MWWRLCPAGLAIAVILGAQSGTFSGVVTDSKTGSPIPNAHAMLNPANGPAGVPSVPYIYMVDWEPTGKLDVDPGGRFTVQSVEPGVYELYAGAKGYCSVVIKADDPYRMDTPFALKAGQHATAQIALDPCAEVHGHVQFQGGAPVPDAMVYLHARDRGVGSESQRTDATGSYAFTGVWDGDYTMEVLPSGLWEGGGALYPIARHPRELHLESGDVLPDIDFTLTPAEPRRLKVHLLTSEGMETRGESLQIRPVLQYQETGDVKSLGIGSGGTEETTLAPGRYAIQFEAHVTTNRELNSSTATVTCSGGSGSVTVSCQKSWIQEYRGAKVIDILPGEDLGIDLPVLPAIRVRVRVLQPGGPVADRTQVRLTNRDFPQGSLECAGDQPRSGAMPCDWQLDSSASWSLAVLGPDVYLDSLRVNGQPQTPTAIQFTRGAREAELEALLGTAGKVYVETPEGAAVYDLRAVLFVYTASGIVERSIQAFIKDAGGQIIEGVPPGRHRLLVWMGEEPPCDLEAISSCSGLGEWVSVKSGETLRVHQKGK